MKSEQLITFENQEIGTIRGAVIDGEPWFIGTQTCKCLGIKNGRDTIKKMHDRFSKRGKGVDNGDTLLKYKNVKIDGGSGGEQKTILINEPFLYALIFRSNKDKAIDFQSWVFGEVLPSLRKHGEYRMTGKLIHRSLTDTIKDDIVPKIESDMGKRFAYSNFQKMINKSLGLDSKIDKDSLSDESLEKIAHRENLVKALIEEGKTYHEIKDIIFSFAK